MVEIGKNTEGVSKPTATDLKNISGKIWQKVVKIGKNTEGVNNRTETDKKQNSGDNLAESGQNWQKRGATGNHFDVYNDCKKKIKKCCLCDDKIKK